MRLLGSFAVIMIAAHFTVCTADNCTIEEYPCLKAIHRYGVCSSLHKKCHELQDSASSFAASVQQNRLPWSKNETCTNSSRFCPLTFNCKPSGSPCDVNAEVLINTTYATPWGQNCTSGQGYCPLTASCMPVANKCSFKALVDWQAAGNTSITPASQECPAGHTFCPATWSCMNGTCAPVAASGVNISSICEEGRKFCYSGMKCIPNNVTCDNINGTFATFNVTGRSDNGTGYAQACMLRHTICARRLAALHKCLPHVPKRCLKHVGPPHPYSNGTNHHRNGTNHCSNGTNHHPNGTNHCSNGTNHHPNGTNHCPNGTNHCPNGTNHHPNGTNHCPNGTNHCPNGTNHHPNGTNHCPNGTNHHPNGTNHCPNGTNHCSNGTYHCSGVGCIGNNATCNGKCKDDQVYCPPKHRCQHKASPCKGERVENVPGPNCTDTQRSCSIVQRKLSVCGSINRICNKLKEDTANFTKLSDIAEHYTPWGERCGEHNAYCPVFMMCAPKNISCNGKSVLPDKMLPNKSPWGEQCPGGKKFCPLVMACIPDSSPCSLKAVMEYVLCEKNVSGNSSCNHPPPFGIACPANMTFCHFSLSCIPKNDSCDYQSFYNNSIACDSGARFCSKSGRCIPGNYTCGTRMKYDFSDGLNGTKRGWVDACKAAEIVCPRILNAAKKCKHISPSNSTRCLKSRCPGKCKIQATQMAQCFSLNKYCPLLANNATRAYLQATLKANNVTPSGDTCKQGKRYCPLVLGCIEVNATCDINTANDDYSPVTPWGEACLFGNYYCPIFGKCIDANIKCRWAHIVNWMNGDKKKSPYVDKMCNGNHTYCLSSRECHSPNVLCKLNPEQTPWSNACPYGQKFCAVNMKCIEDHTPCAFNSSQDYNSTFGFRCAQNEKYCSNFYGCTATSANCSAPAPQNDVSGWATMCKYKMIGCQNIFYGVKKCKSQCPWEFNAAAGCPEGQKICSSSGRCMPKDQKCCQHGSKFCNTTATCIPKNMLCCPSNKTLCTKTSQCIAKGSPCLGPRECVAGQSYCSELTKCIPSGQSCAPKLPPPSATKYKMVPNYVTLDKAANASIFPAGKNTIALVSIDTFGQSGELQYLDGGVWKNVTSLAQGTAFVVGQASKLRFRYTEETDHGLVLANYTVKAGSVGATVNATADARQPDQTLVFLTVPNVPMPRLSLTGNKYEILEDSKGKGIQLSDLIQMEVKNVSTENKLPRSVFPFIPRSVVSYYFDMLDEVRNTMVGVACVQLSGEGVWEIKEDGKIHSNDEIRTTVKPFFVNNTKDRVRFIPYSNWNGNISFSVVGYKFVKSTADDLGLTYRDLPLNVQKALSMVQRNLNISKSVRGKLRSAGEELKKQKTRPSEKDLTNALGAMLAKVSNSKDKQDIGMARTVIVESYKQALVMQGNGPVNPKYKSIEKTIRGRKGVIRFAEKVVIFNGRVIPVNDRPEVSSLQAYFPPIAYNTTTTPNNGFLVNDLTTKPAVPYGRVLKNYEKSSPLAKDTDGAMLGIGVISATNSSIGAWYYKANSSVSWTRMEVNNVVTNDRKSGNASVFILPHTARVKFEMHNPDFMWNELEARAKALMLFAAWDGSDGMSLGLHNYTFPLDKMSSLSRIMRAHVSRLGCDGTVGSKGKIDQCGKCGGDGQWCLGCDGVKFSGDKINRCMICTLGTTGRALNYGEDCAGGCGASYNDSCGICQERGKERNFTDCSGRCSGSAKINRCGNCVGGSTGKAKNYGEDVCGVCGGDATSCRGCDGVANSGKVLDLCKTCLLPTDPTFNSACTKLSAMLPTSGPKAGGTNVNVQGAGLHRFKVAKCKFEPNSGGAGVAMANADIRTHRKTKRKYFVLSSPVIAGAGEQKLKCTFDSDSTVYELTDKTFYAYDKSAFTFTSISPNNSEAANAPFNASVTGTGFVNTSYIKCVSNKKVEFDAHYVSSTEVKCDFPTSPKSSYLYIVVAFGESDKQLVKSSAVRFQFWVKAPVPVSVRFLQNLQGLLVIMDKDAKLAGSKSRDCATFFESSSASKFGGRAKCVLLTGRKMLIKLLGSRGNGPAIVPADSISFIKGSLIRRHQEVTKNTSGFHNLTVSGPPVTVTPTAMLSAPSSLGVCGPLKLSASKSKGGGGRKLAFTWTVKWADSQDNSSLTSAQRSDLTSIQSFLSSLPSFSPIVKIDHPKIKTGPEYEFGVSVKNFLGSTSQNETVVITRKNTAIPSVTVGGKVIRIKAAKDTTLAARVKLSPCLSGDVGAKVAFSWSINAVGVNIGRKDKPKLRIKKGTLQGGKSYTLTVSIAMASDPDLSAQDTTTIQVVSGPLVAVIRGGSYKVVGQGDTITLNGAGSKDPDDLGNLNSKPWYMWECFDKSGFPCFEPDPKNPSKEKRMVLDSSAKVSIDVAKRLTTNSEYKFVLTFNKDTRNATAEIRIYVEAGSPPKVSIKPQRNTKENPTDKVVIIGTVTSKIDKTNVTWSCVQEEGYGYVDLTTPGVVMTNINDVLRKKHSKSVGRLKLALLLAENVLMEDTKYKFRLTATHTDSSAYAETTFVTNAPPSQGFLEVSPTNGTALQTKFEIKADYGWSDDAEDLPLEYRFGFYKKKGGKTIESLISGRGEKNILERILPTGDKDDSYKLKLFVDVFDIYSARTRAEFEITSSPNTNMSSAVFGALANDMGNALASGQVSEALGNTNAVMGSVLGSDGVPSPDAKPFQQDVTNQILGVPKSGGIVDPGTEMEVMSTIATTTTGGDTFDPALKSDLSNTIMSMVTGGDSDNARRKRRSVEAPAITPYTSAQAESALAILGNLITAGDYSTDGMSYKANFLKVGITSGLKMCANLDTGLPAVNAKTTYSVVSSVKNNYAKVATEYIDVACSDCPDNVKATAKVLLGSTLQESYESWACTGDTTCSGTCVVSTQFPYDLLLNATDNSSITNTVHMNLYNPETYAELDPGTLAYPYTLRLPLEYNSNTTTFDANQTRTSCKRWDAAVNEWSTDGCVQTAQATLVTEGNTVYVECQCTKLGYIGGFAAEGALPTTAAPVTNAPTEIKNTLPPPVQARMAFNEDYDKFVNKYGKAAMEKSITNQIVSTLELNASRIANLTISKGSIIVTFLILADPTSNTSSLTELNAKIAQLQQAVKSGNFSVTLPDGSKMTADPNSFVVGPIPTTAAPVHPTESSGLTQTEIIIISVVCGVVVLVVLIVVVLCCCKKKSGKVSPRGSQANLMQRNDVEMADRGKENTGYADYTPNNSRKV